MLCLGLYFPQWCALRTHTIRMDPHSSGCPGSRSVLGMRIWSQEHGSWPKFTNNHVLHRSKRILSLGFWPTAYLMFIFYVKIKIVWLWSLTRIRICIRTDPHWEKKLDPDPDPHHCFCIYNFVVQGLLLLCHSGGSVLACGLGLHPSHERVRPHRVQRGRCLRLCLSRGHQKVKNKYLYRILYFNYGSYGAIPINFFRTRKNGGTEKILNPAWRTFRLDVKYGICRQKDYNQNIFQVYLELFPAGERTPE